MPSTPLADRVAIVTGAARGIGRATAQRLARDGAAVVVNDIDDKPLDAVVSEISESGGRAVACVGNTAVNNIAQELVDVALEMFGALDIVVNNAGVTHDRMFQNLTRDDLDLALDANLRTAWETSQAAIGHMRKAAKDELAATGEVDHQRKLVFTSSVAALTGNPGQANYTVAKGALIALTKTLAQELGPFGINVNAVAPGFIETRLTAPKQEGETLGIPDQIRDSIRAMIALGRFGQAEDIANVTAFLVSPDSDYVSGVTLPVTGGQFGGMG